MAPLCPIGRTVIKRAGYDGAGEGVMEIFAFYYQPWVLFIWGACWGSFLNVVMYRFPLGKSVIHPGSACPYCAKEIAFYDNIPVLSWLILRGRCRQCKAPYSIRYPIYEAAFGLVTAIPVVIHPEDWRLGLLLGTLGLASIPMIVLLVRCGKAPVYLWLIALAVGAGYAALAI
jgi:prepilin signal peptidase PulO-like enzyme (type II secretory pathway)